MIYKATMHNGKRKAEVWLVGRAFSGGLTRWQEYHAWTELAKRTRADDYAFASFYERKHDGTLEIVCAGNTF